jgi:hypothetical protein
LKGCYNDPRTKLTEGDKKAIEDFKQYLQEKKDKRDQCGCHKKCTTLEHECEKPCEWPKCLTPEEHDELLKSISPEDFA